MRSLLIFLALVILFPSTVLAVDDTWNIFEPYQTEEETVITIFGTPDSVAIYSSYEDLKKTKESCRTDLFSAYELTYNRFRGDLNILKGPLGEAASTKVLVEDGKVVTVNWNYEVKYKAAAERLWKNDKNITTKVGKAITIGEKILPGNNVLFVTCTTGENGKCDGLIQVTISRNPVKK